MSAGQSLLSKIIDDNNVKAFALYGIERDHFPTEAERKAYDFIVQYAQENGGQAPSYATFVAENPDITYIPAVSDSYEYLARKLKDAAGKRRFAELYEKEIPQLYESSDTESLIEDLIERLDRIKMDIRTGVRTPGKTLEELRADFRQEYERRKAGKSFKLWRTPFPTLNDEIGGLFSGDIYVIMAESGRGKTYLSEVFVDELLRQGAKVLVKSYEVKSYSWLSRLISILTAHEGALTDDEKAQVVGLPNKALLAGRLDSEIEAYFFEVLDALDRYYPGTLILQAKGDDDITRTLADLDRELAQNPDIDVIVIDPFYGITDVYGRNANRTAGGAAEMAARYFESIVGKHDVVGIFTIQASTERQETEEGEENRRKREIKLPRRDQVKTTKAVLEIATNLFTFDAVDGLGRIGVEKGRNGGEGFTVDLLALMDYGVLREMPKGEVAAAQFAAGF